DAEAAVDVHLAAVVLPRDPKDDLTFRLADPLDDLVLGVVRVLVQDRRERLRHFGDGLVKLALARIAPDDVLYDGSDSRIDVGHFHGSCRKSWNSGAAARRIDSTAVRILPRIDAQGNSERRIAQGRGVPGMRGGPPRCWSA